MNALEHKVPPPLVAALIGAAMWASSHVAPNPAIDGVAMTIVGWIFVVVGTGISASGLIAFHRAKTTVNPLKPETASSLVTGGVYRITRNPMYLGLLLVLAGGVFFLGNVWSALGPVVFVAYITRFQIKPEERAMLSLFGEEYVRYSSKVRRWL